MGCGRTQRLLLAVVLVAGCGGYSQNHRRGLMAAGGAAVLVGAVMAVDGAYCDESAGGAGDCRGDELPTGLAVLAAGLVLGGVAWWIQPPAEVKTTAASSAPPAR
jgi:hypothetical protein